MTSPALSGQESARRAVVTAIRDDDAPASAWPDRYPGRWTTAARVAELVGRSTSEVNHDLRRLAERGEILSERPWPGGTRGYQPTAELLASTPELAGPIEIHDRREWMLSRLADWAETHGGHAPSQADWSAARDPERRWPRADAVIEFFTDEARAVGARRFADARCEPCICSHGRHYRNDEGDSLCVGCFDCMGSCPHGTNGEWVGPSGWEYAMQLARLSVLRGDEYHATPAQSLGRNRQMVTGGVADQWPQRFER